MPPTPSHPDPRTDDHLIALANATGGGPDAAAAFEALYARYRDWVFSLALRFTRNHDTALDVTQEVFIYFLRKFPGFTLTARLTTFLYPAVKNLAIAHRDKAHRFAGNDDALAALPDRSADEFANTASGGKHAELAGIMEALSQGHREVLLLRFVDGLSLQEIATALELPVGTVKSRMHNALSTLRDDPRAKKYFEA